MKTLHLMKIRMIATTNQKNQRIKNKKVTAVMGNKTAILMVIKTKMIAKPRLE